MMGFVKKHVQEMPCPPLNACIADPLKCSLKSVTNVTPKNTDRAMYYSNTELNIKDTIFK